MSRRLRCPYCLSLNTIEGVSATREGKNIQWFHVCDDCDTSWSTDPKSDLYHAPAKMKKAEAAK